MKGLTEYLSCKNLTRPKPMGAALAVGIALLPLIATTGVGQETTPTETVLYNFTGGADGGVPEGGLIRDAAGNLYGTTNIGGNTSSSCPLEYNGCGVVFELLSRA
jgi:hypothetical protein